MMPAARLARVAVVTALTFLAFTPAALAASPPVGHTGIALSSRVDLAWQPSAGATAYAVYRGTSAASVTTRVSPAGGVLGTTFSDTSAANGTTYFYAVRAIEGGFESSDSKLVQATPAARSCSTGNPVVLENCYPGSPAWKTLSVQTTATGGVEGFATAQSINRGGSVGLKMHTGATATTVNVEVYRMGDYGGTGARLLSVMRGINVGAQPACANDPSTGLVDCGNWSTSTTLSTTAAWTSGMYLLRIVRTDTNADNHILLTVRDDAREPALVFGSGYSTFQAYNPWGGRSLYNWSSSGANTVAGSPRAVKVSFDRPYDQTRFRQHDWFTDVEQPVVAWLERQGIDTGYIADTDLERNPGFAQQGSAYFSPAHDEYVSSNMRTALETARNAGTGLFFSGANAVFWRVRFETGPQNGGQDRILVCYKTTESGAEDPVSSTKTWRDVTGPNQPENGLIGQMYIGQNTGTFFPLRVTGAQAEDRLFRYTSLDGLAPTATATLGSTIVGWEWDGRVNNGAEPAGVKTLASSPASGDILQDAGRVYAPGSANATVTKYKHASGALVFASGTNQWWRGLGKNIFNDGEPNNDIQQITANALADMGAVATTPTSAITVDVPPDPVKVPGGVNAAAAGSDSVMVSWNAVAGATSYSVYRLRQSREGGYPLGIRANAAAITGTSFTDTGLSSSVPYYYIVTATVGGVQSAPSAEVSATPPAGASPPIRINVGGPAYTAASGTTWQADQFFTGGATSSTSHAITGTNDPAIYQNERWGDFTYAIPVPNGTYDVRMHFAEAYFGTAAPGGAGSRLFGMDVVDTTLNPDLAVFDIFASVGANAALVKTIASVKVTDGTLNLRTVRGPADDPELTGLEIISAPPPGPPVVTARNPGDGSIGVPVLADATATFSRDMDAATLNSTNVKLERASDSAAVAAAVSYSAATRTATLNPNAALAYNTTYRARLTTGVKADDGIAMANAVSWTFTTGDPPPPPTVTGRTPAPGATGVDKNAKPTATFSRDMDGATITGSTFTLRGPGDTAVLASVSYDAATRTARITPSSALAFATVYTAEVAASVRSADNVALGAAVSWTFTTADPPPPDTQAPTVSVTAPAGGATLIGKTKLTATAADNVGVVGVQFKRDGVNLGPELTSAPYEYDWNTFGTANGAHTITAVARDDAGNSTPSAVVNVNLNNPAVDPEGLVGAWGFEETSGSAVTDASPASNNGTITGAARTANGRFGSALTFAQASDWVTIPSSSTLNPGTGLTLEAWVNPTQLNYWHTVLLRERGSNAMAYALYAHNDVNRASGHVSTGGSESHASATSQLALNTWTHLATTYDGSNIRLYVNGTLVSTKAMTGSVDTSTLPLRIGANNVWGEPFKGTLDEIRVYRRTLSAAEIATDMAAAVKPAVPDTTPPTVSLTAPSANATVSGTVNVTASASDDRGIASVQFKANGQDIGSPDTSAPFTVPWNTTTVTNGARALTAVATDVGGNTTTSAAVQVTVDNGSPPTVSITAPAAGATVTGSATLQANAADDRGIASVQFKVDGNNVGAADTNAPYSVAWESSTVANGSHTITAVATDTDGNTTTSSGRSITTSNTSTVPSGLVAAYGFEEPSGTTALDASGNALNGTILGTTRTTGRFGNALSFNGATDWVTVADAAPLHLSSGMTLEAWVRPTSVSGWRTAILKEQSGGMSYGLYASTDTNRPSGHVHTNVEVDTRGTAALPTNAWTHLALTYDGSNLRLYVDGTQVSSKPVSGTVTFGSQPLRIGGNSIWGEHFAGLIDEVRVYNRALSVLELQGDLTRAVP
jgi:hypothetical protein